MDDNELPTVATIIGCPEQLTGTNGLVATPIGLPGSLGENGADDAIQKALLGNLCSGFLQKKDRDLVHCNICDVSCTGELAYKSHIAGARHAKKVKEKEAGPDVTAEPFIHEDPNTKTFECTLCNVKLNAKNQIAAHVAGAKHKIRLVPNEKIYSAAPQKMPYVADLSANLLYCPTCGIHANSTLQMEQHMTSVKHVNKVNGNSVPTPRRAMGAPTARFTPYPGKAFDNHVCNRREPIRNRNYDDHKGGGYWAQERLPNSRFFGVARGGFDYHSPNHQKYNGRHEVSCARHGPTGYSY